MLASSWTLQLRLLTKECQRLCRGPSSYDTPSVTSTVDGVVVGGVSVTDTIGVIGMDVVGGVGLVGAVGDVGGVVSGVGRWSVVGGRWAVVAEVVGTQAHGEEVGGRWPAVGWVLW